MFLVAIVSLFVCCYMRLCDNFRCYMLDRVAHFILIMAARLFYFKFNLLRIGFLLQLFFLVKVSINRCFLFHSNCKAVALLYKVKRFHRKRTGGPFAFLFLISSSCIFFFSLAFFFNSHASLLFRILHIYFPSFIFITWILECKYRLNVNHAYLFSCHLLYCADHRMYNRLNVIVLGGCACVCVCLLFSL